MHQVITSADTLQKAVSSALEQLNAKEDEVNIDIINSGRKGFLGIGAKKAVVKVTKKNYRVLDLIDSSESKHDIKEDLLQNSAQKTEDILTECFVNSSTEINELSSSSDDDEKLAAAKRAKQFIANIAINMDIDVEITLKMEDDVCYLMIYSKKASILIGKKGQVLISLEALAQMVANKQRQPIIKIYLDAENYRSNRYNVLKRLAIKTAEKAITLNKEISLDAMPSYDRKIVHQILAKSNLNVNTYSVGHSSNRYVVVSPEQRFKS